MAMTLLTTNTSSNAASSSFTSSIDSTYKLYIFKFIDVNPATDAAYLTFQANAVDASGYNETMMTTFFSAYHNEGGSSTSFSYRTGQDQQNGTAFQRLSDTIGNGADECIAGTLWLFNPSNTTYTKYFCSNMQEYGGSDFSYNGYAAGYFNITAAIDDIQFKMSSGNMDAIIKMYGVG